MSFTWYKVEDGVAIPYDDTPEVAAMVNKDGRNWYGNIESAIINGGVKATAFKRKTEKTYDAIAWLERGEMVPAGEITTTTITAEWKGE